MSAYTGQNKDTIRLGNLNSEIISEVKKAISRVPMNSDFEVRFKFPDNIFGHDSNSKIEGSEKHLAHNPIKTNDGNFQKYKKETIKYLEERLPLITKDVGSGFDLAIDSADKNILNRDWHFAKKYNYSDLDITFHDMYIQGEDGEVEWISASEIFKVWMDNIFFNNTTGSNYESYSTVSKYFDDYVIPEMEILQFSRRLEVSDFDTLNETTSSSGKTSKKYTEETRIDIYKIRHDANYWKEYVDKEFSKKHYLAGYLNDLQKSRKNFNNPIASINRIVEPINNLMNTIFQMHNIGGQVANDLSSIDGKPDNPEGFTERVKKTAEFAQTEYKDEYLRYIQMKHETGRLNGIFSKVHNDVRDNIKQVWDIKEELVDIWDKYVPKEYNNLKSELTKDKSIDIRSSENLNTTGLIDFIKSKITEESKSVVTLHEITDVLKTMLVNVNKTINTEEIYNSIIGTLKSKHINIGKYQDSISVTETIELIKSQMVPVKDIIIEDSVIGKIEDKLKTEYVDIRYDNITGDNIQYILDGIESELVSGIVSLGDSSIVDNIKGKLKIEGIIIGDVSIFNNIKSKLKSGIVSLGDSSIVDIIKGKLKNEVVSLGDSSIIDSIKGKLKSENINIDGSSLIGIIKGKLVSESISIGDSSLVDIIKSKLTTEGISLGDESLIENIKGKLTPESLLLGDNSLVDMIRSKLLSENIDVGVELVDIICEHAIGDVYKKEFNIEIGNYYTGKIISDNINTIIKDTIEFYVGNTITENINKIIADDSSFYVDSIIIDNINTIIKDSIDYYIGTVINENISTIIKDSIDFYVGTIINENIYTIIKDSIDFYSGTIISDDIKYIVEDSNDFYSGTIISDNIDTIIKDSVDYFLSEQISNNIAKIINKKDFYIEYQIKDNIGNIINNNDWSNLNEQISSEIKDVINDIDIYKGIIINENIKDVIKENSVLNAEFFKGTSVRDSVLKSFTNSVNVSKGIKYYVGNIIDVTIGDLKKSIEEFVENDLSYSLKIDTIINDSSEYIIDKNGNDTFNKFKNEIKAIFEYTLTETLDNTSKNIDMFFGLAGTHMVDDINGDDNPDEVPNGNNEAGMSDIRKISGKVMSKAIEEARRDGFPDVTIPGTDASTPAFGVIVTALGILSSGYSLYDMYKNVKQIFSPDSKVNSDFVNSGSTITNANTILKTDAGLGSAMLTKVPGADFFADIEFTDNMVNSVFNYMKNIDPVFHKNVNSFQFPINWNEYENLKGDARYGKSNIIKPGNSHEDEYGILDLTPIKTYKFYDLYPFRISYDGLNYDDSDKLTSFKVSFRYTHFEQK